MERFLQLAGGLGLMLLSLIVLIAFFTSGPRTQADDERQIRESEQSRRNAVYHRAIDRQKYGN